MLRSVAVLALLGAAVLLWWCPSETPSEKGLAVEGDAPVSGGGKLAGLSRHDPVRDAPSTEEPAVGDKRDGADPASLEELRDAAPEGVPEEWPLLKLGLAAGVPSDEMERMFHETVEFAFLDEAPYRAIFVFGPSDLPWLRQVHARFQAELGEIVDAHQGPENVTEQQVLVAEMCVRYRQVLCDIALRRAHGSRELRARLNDGTVLRDLPDGASRAWLDGMIRVVEGGSLWADSEVLPREYRVLVSAKDLDYIKRMSAELWRVSGPDYPDSTYEELLARQRAVLGQVRDTLKARSTK